MDYELLKDIIIPIVTAILGLFGGMKIEKYKLSKNNSKKIIQNVKKDNNGIMAGGSVINVFKEKQ